jgi:ATP-dependent DNA helicase RecG
MLKLNSSVTKIPLVGPAYAKRLKKLGISNIEDLISHVPSRYLDFRKVVRISNTNIGDVVTVKGKIRNAANIFTRTRKLMQVATIKDKSGTIEAIWFNQPYLTRTLNKGAIISLSGEIKSWMKKKAFISPEFELKPKKQGVHTGRLVPIYPETAGLSSKWLRSRINFALPRVENKLKEFLPIRVLNNYNLLNIKETINKLHFPKDLKGAQAANDRFAFNELLFLQLLSNEKLLDWKTRKVTHNLKVDNKEINNFIKSLPFNLTKSQSRSINEILVDLKLNIPMNRLLEGDVGSGKTVVAATACFASFLNGYQSIIMAPTQILANQHYNTLDQLFDKYKVRTSLVTSQTKKKDPGSTDIFVGTHALIHKKVKFDNVAVVVIDEQHRFGVEQRAHLTNTVNGQKFAPHVLTMTATPIPRTVVLTVYGDLKLSTLDELPKGRQPITTWTVPPKKRESAYDWIGEQIKKDKVQAFVICPLIDESESEKMTQIKAATVEYENLKKIYPDLKLGLLHGRLKENEKNKVLDNFKSGKIDLMVSTPVVEVGIDVPNATTMMIEGADRFGLAQLHQLRGRVGRGKKKSYCLLFTESQSRTVQQRLSALKRNMSGFELAELDLKLRGPGEIFGTLQSGYQELKIASWQNTKLIKDTKKVADDAVSNRKYYSKLFKHLLSKNIALN